MRHPILPYPGRQYWGANAFGSPLCLNDRMLIEI